MNLTKTNDKVTEYINKEIEITDFTYKWNLYFYTILKTLIQTHLTEMQLIKLQTIVLKNKEIYDANEIQEFLLNAGIVKENTKKYEGYQNLISLIDSYNYNAWTAMIDIGIDLILFKNLILEEAKAYVINKNKEIEKSIDDKLSLAYDTSRLCMPYGQKVISALLVYTLTNIERKTTFTMSTSNKSVKEIHHKLKYIANNYNINCNNIMLLIVDESTNQSIKSGAGVDYESRVQEMLNGKVNKLKEHTHDSNLSAMEYDYTFELKNKKFGVSAKRTLRERYKQNHEDIEVLDVDYVLLFTLGTDLNEDKVKSILQKNGIYVVVASELYEMRDYLNNNERVISSKDLTKSTLESIIK